MSGKLERLIRELVEKAVRVELPQDLEARSGGPYRTTAAPVVAVTLNDVLVASVAPGADAVSV